MSSMKAELTKEIREHGKGGLDVSTRTRTLEEMHMTVDNCRKVGWLTESAADIISEELRKELLRALREEGDVKLRGKKVST